MIMHVDFIIMGLLLVLLGLVVRLKAKFLSERIGAVGFLLMGILLVLAGLIF